MKIKALGEHGKQLLKSSAFIKIHDYDTKKYSPEFLRQKEIFNKLVDERRNEILELSEKMNYNNLTYNFKDKNICEKSFNDFDNAISLF